MNTFHIKASHCTVNFSLFQSQTLNGHHGGRVFITHTTSWVQESNPGADEGSVWSLHVLPMSEFPLCNLVTSTSENRCVDIRRKWGCD